MPFSVLALVGSRRYFIAEARVRFQVSSGEVVVGKVTVGEVFIRVLPFLLVTIIPPVFHTSFHLHGTLTKTIVNLHSQWEAV